MTLEEVLSLAKQLSLPDKVQLVTRIMPEIEQEIVMAQATPRKSLWGLCADLGNAPTAEEIGQAREEMWGNFPREDI
jgi:hypothetical protein